MATEPQIGALSEENRRVSKAITLAAAALLLLGTLIFLVILALTYLNMRYIRPSLEYQA